MMASISTQDGYINNTENFVDEKERAESLVTSWIQHQPTPMVKAAQTQYDKVNNFSRSLTDSVDDEEGEEEEVSQRESKISRDAHTLNVNSFLSSSGSEFSDDEELLETVLTDLYNDPLDVCMEGIEDLATGILRTGKLLVNGEPGDMTRIHPAIFNLQATEKNISQLLPQLLQDPFFFYQLGQESDYSINNNEDDYPLSSLTGCMHDEALANGHIRLALPVDTAIYVLIKSHCSKGARQAEEMINTSLNGNYVMSHNLTDFHVMPPIIKFCSSKVNQSGSSTHRKISSEIGNCVCDVTVGGVSSKPFQSTSSLCLERNIGIPLFPPDERPDSVSRKNSNSSNLADVSNVSSSSSVACIPISDCVLSSENQNTLAHTSSKRKRHSTSSMIQEIEPIIEEEREFSGTLPPSPPRIGNGHQQCQTTLMKPLSNSKGRKMSIYHAPTRKDSTGSDTSVGDAPCYIPGGDQWNTSIIDNNTIIAQYGAMPYPMVFWDPKFMIDFHLNTSTGLLSDKVTGIDLSKPEVTLRVINNLPKRIGFAIRSNRLSTVFKTHVVYPNRGLEIVDAYKSWEDKVEFYPNNPDMMDMFAVDLFFCTMDAKPVWNIIRKYAIMKAQKTNKSRKRISKRRLSHIHMVGDPDQKEENLKLVISHGLQCVVKGKLNEAEIIFSHALYLPDFQRLPLKAFIYICLAVIANKWKKKGSDSMTLKPVMLAAQAASKLVEVCEQGPGSMKMPRTIQLVKQLKKELNLPKLVKDQHKRKKIASTKDTLKMGPETVDERISPSGNVLSFKDTIIVIPPLAVKKSMQVTLNSSDTRHLTAMLKASGWGKTVRVITALHINTSIPVSCFDVPIQITTPVPDGVKLRENSLLRLMHSTYLSLWEDITNNKLSKICLSLECDKLNIETDLPGWLTVSVIELDASVISQMVLKCISMKPMLIRLTVYGFLDAECQSMQVAIFLVPCNANEEPLYKDFNIPENFVPISFPQVIQAYPNEKMRLEIQGSSFEPDASLGEDNLVFDVTVQQRHNEVHTKWIKMTSPANQPLRGKMKITCCRGNTGLWEMIAHMNLSTQTT